MRAARVLDMLLILQRRGRLTVRVNHGKVPVEHCADCGNDKGCLTDDDCGAGTACGSCCELGVEAGEQRTTTPER